MAERVSYDTIYVVGLFMVCMLPGNYVGESFHVNGICNGCRDSTDHIHVVVHHGLCPEAPKKRQGKHDCLDYLELGQANKRENVLQRAKNNTRKRKEKESASGSSKRTTERYLYLCVTECFQPPDHINHPARSAIRRLT